MLTEKVGANTTTRYVWSPVYLDAIVLRDRDADGDGSMDERLWVIQDANFNVTALVDGTGAVVERYTYDPYGVRTVYDVSYVEQVGGSNYGWGQGFQGMIFDNASGLYVSRGRPGYSPTLGRWVTMDPLDLAPDVNAYRFVGGNPGGYTDPSGLDRIDQRPGGVYYVDTGPFFDTTTHLGTLIPNNGDPLVVRYVNGTPYYVPLATVNRTTSNWVDTPSNWSQWFKDNAIDVNSSTWGNGRIQAGIAMAGRNDMAVGVQQSTQLANTAVYWNAGAGFNVSPCEAATLVGMAVGGGRVRPVPPPSWVPAKTISGRPSGFVRAPVTVDRSGRTVEGLVDLRPTLGRIASGGRYPHRNDGSIFGNWENRLPNQPYGYYTKYVVPPPVIPGTNTLVPGWQAPGAQRIVVGQGGEAYYTGNHYASFIRIN